MSVPSNIKTAFEEYGKVAERAEERQAEWNARTKEFVFRTLSNLVAELRALSGALSVAGSVKRILAIKDDSQRNFHTVCIGFPIMPSDIVLERNGGYTGVQKIGGHLFYSQVFNGKILVGIAYPYFTELQDAKPNKGIALLDPEELTEELIYKHVEHFLNEITESEHSPSIEEEVKQEAVIRHKFGSAITPLKVK